MLWLIDYYTIHVAFAFRFGQRFHREPYMSESSDPHGYVVTTSINCTDRWFCLPMIYVSERYSTRVWRVGLGSLRKSDLMLQALLSHHLVLLIPFSEENTVNPVGHSFGRARLYLLGLHPSIEFSPSKCVYTLPWPWSLDLNYREGCLQSYKRNICRQL